MGEKLLLCVLVLYTLTASVYAASYQNSEKRYHLTYLDGWKQISYPTPVDVAFACTLSNCGDEVRLSVNANFTPQLHTASLSEFFQMMPPENFIDAVRQMVSSIGSVEVLVYPVRRKIGNTEGYVGHFKLEYIDGRVRHLTYANTFRNGYFYHIQVFSPEKTPQNVFDLIGRTLSGFGVN